MELKAINQNNLQVGNKYIQTLPKALHYTGINSKKLLRAYNESLELFKARISTKKTTHGDYEIITVNGKLYSRNTDRLKMLACEILLKAWTMRTGNIAESIQNINDDVKLPLKAWSGAI